MSDENEKTEKMPNLKIGEILIEIGCLTRLQLEQALQMQEGGFRHLRLGEIMVRTGVVTEEELSAGLVEQQRRFRSQLGGSV